MRKLFIFLLTAAVLCSSCACGKSGADDRNKVIGGDENTASGPVELLSMPASQRINTLIYQVNPKLYGSKKDAEMVATEKRFAEKLGTKVALKGTMKKGKLEISYKTKEELLRLYEIIGR